MKSFLDLLTRGVFGLLVILVAIGIGRTLSATGKIGFPDMTYLNSINTFAIARFNQVKNTETPELQINIQGTSPTPTPVAPKVNITSEIAGKRESNCKNISSDSVEITRQQISYIESRLQLNTSPLMQQEVYEVLGQPYCTIDKVETSGNYTEAWMPDSSIQASDRIRLVIQFSNSGRVKDYKLEAVN